MRIFGIRMKVLRSKIAYLGRKDHFAWYAKFPREAVFTWAMIDSGFRWNSDAAVRIMNIPLPNFSSCSTLSYAALVLKENTRYEIETGH